MSTCHEIAVFFYTPDSHGENEGISPMKDEVKTTQKLVEELASAKQRIAELEQAGKKYLTIIQNIRDGVYMLDNSGKFTFVNDVLVKRSGFHAEWFIGRSYLDVVSKEDRERVERIFNAAKDGRTQTYDLYLSYPTASGKPICVEVCAVPLLDGDEVIGRLGISRDVTERKQAEKAFQESEERFRLAAESTADLIWEWDIRTGDLAWFGPIDKALGYETDEFPRTIDAWERIIHPDDHAHVMAGLDRHLKDRTPYDKEYRVLRKDGGVIYWADRGCAVWNQEGEPCKMFGAVTDITDRKLLEDRIKASERQFRTFIESIPIGIFVYEGSKFSYLNLASERITGYTRDELYLLDVWEIVHPDFRDIIREHMHRRQRGESVPDYHEFKIITKSGEERWLGRGVIAIKMDGEPLFLLTATDITDRRQVEEVLRKSEEKYRALMENSSDAILLADEHGDLIEANKTAEKLFGYTREELLQMHYTQIHPMMELERTIAAFKDIVTHGQGGLQNGAIQRKDGTVVPIDITSTVIQYSGRKVIQAAFRDITEHRQMEDTLERLVRERTAELSEKNKQMVEEIKERKRAEAALRKKTKELQLHTGKLEELNSALKVLLKRREEDKTDLEEKIISNVKEIVEPYVKKLRKTRLNMDQSTYVNIIETNLNGIISPFLRDLTSKHPNLTSREIQIAYLIKAGKITKEIMDIMGSSKGAIDFHRNNIRAKLGLKNKKSSLRSYLLSMS